jgi:hypothetical protein
VHAAPACTGYREGSNHFGSYVHNLSLHFCKRLFLVLEPMTSWSQGNNFTVVLELPFIPCCINKKYVSVQEMIPASTLALPDKLGMRSPNRLRIRPRPQQNSYVDSAALLPGTAVDVWQFSGWWEGVVVSLHDTAADSLQIYFPGNNLLER